MALDVLLSSEAYSAFFISGTTNFGWNRDFNDLVILVVLLAVFGFANNSREPQFEIKLKHGLCNWTNKSASRLSFVIKTCKCLYLLTSVSSLSKHTYIVVAWSFLGEWTIVWFIITSVYLQARISPGSFYIPNAFLPSFRFFFWFFVRSADTSLLEHFKLIGVHCPLCFIRVRGNLVHGSLNIRSVSIGIN